MYDSDDNFAYLMSPNAIAAETIREIYQLAPSMPSFLNWERNWEMPSVSISDWVYENPTDPQSLMQPWFVLLTQAMVGVIAYKMLPVVGHAAAKMLDKAQNVVLDASGYDTSVDLNAPRPKAGYLKAMLVGTAKVAVSCSRYIAEKCAHLGGTLAVVVNTPNMLNSEPMQMIRNVGLNAWLQRDLPLVANFTDAVKNLSWADLSNGWQTFNTQGANYTSQGVSAVTATCSSIYADPFAWAQWGFEGAVGAFSSCFNTAWQIVEPTVTSGLNSLHGCTRDAVSTCTYGLFSGQGLEPYVELGTLALVAGLYWRFGRVTVNNTNNVTGNHVVINTVERPAIVANNS